jgi:peptide/nickel transport system ATP-binding protein
MEKMSNTDTNAHLLSIRNLEVEYSSSGSIIHAVNGVSFDVDAGTTLGLVGETGAGKTTIAKSILRILPDHATKAVRGEIYFSGQNLLKVPDADMRKVRGKRISMIFQDPMTSLNPVKTVINQIAESIRVHQKLDKAGANKKAVEILEMVGISADRADEYPHQFSGGMKQRVVIALALACSPELLIADEPTTALDVTIQAQVLDLIARLREDIHTSMILITHDLGVVADQCDTVAVVYAGNIVEFGSKEDIFDHPSHPYTRGLFGSLPDLNKKVRRLSPVKGLPPDPTNLPSGCAFNPRCPDVTDACKREAIKQTEISPGHFCRCCNPKFLVA